MFSTHAKQWKETTIMINEKKLIRHIKRAKNQEKKTRYQERLDNLQKK